MSLGVASDRLNAAERFRYLTRLQAGPAAPFEAPSLSPSPASRI